MAGKPVTLTSRGEITVKGLEMKQRTYFAEPSHKYIVIEAEPDKVFKKQNSDSFVSLHNVARSSFSIHAPIPLLGDRSGTAQERHRKVSAQSKHSAGSFLNYEVPIESAAETEGTEEMQDEGLVMGKEEEEKEEVEEEVTEKRSKRSVNRDSYYKITPMNGELMYENGVETKKQRKRRKSKKKKREEEHESLDYDGLKHNHKCTIS